MSSFTVGMECAITDNTVERGFERFFENVIDLGIY